MSHPSPEPLPGSRLVTQFSSEQRGIVVAALVALVGIAYIGPAIGRAAERGNALKTRAGKRLRRLGGGTILRTRR